MINLSLHAGYDVAYLTDAVGDGGADYYLSAAGKNGEPPGIWAGKGAKALNLAGDVDADVMRGLYHDDTAPDGEQLDTPGRRAVYAKGATLEQRIDAEVAARVANLGRYVTEREVADIRLQVASKQRTTVRFFDFTLSLVKSVSVLHASFMAAAKQAREDGDHDEAVRCTDQARAIEEAVREGARQVVRSAEAVAGFVRTGHHGDGMGQWRDAEGLTAAIFLQHTSRDGDPQLHAHIAVLNRARRADGDDARWRTLDSRSLHRERLGLAARAGMVVEARMMAAGFDLVARSDGNGREVKGVTPATMRAFSSRRTTITPAIAGLVDEYLTVHGHPPSRRALWSIRQWATLQTRRNKHEVERSPADSLRVWEAQSAAAEVQILADVRRTVEEFGAARDVARPCTEDLHRAIRIAVHEVQRQNASWTQSQLAWELYRAMPPRPAGDSTVDLLQSMLAAALTGGVPEVDVVSLAPAPDVTDVSMLGVRESDGRSVYRPPGEARYCTADMLDTEEWLIRTARQPVRQVVDDDAARAAGEGMSRNQAEVLAGLLTATTAVTVLAGPAGSGKTTVMAAFAGAWTSATAGRVIGVAASTNAARQLADAGMPETYNIAQFLGKLRPDPTMPLAERITGEVATRGHVTVEAGDVLVVDESSQVSTEDLAAIVRIARAYGARVVLTGDTAQLGAVDAGGIMPEIAKHQGWWQLHEVRRFDEPWEARASVEMRDGDLRSWLDYKAHGRVRHGAHDEAMDKAVELYVADLLAGRETILMAGSNAEAADLARLVRVQLAGLGRLPEAPRVTLADGNEAGTGDLVRARLNSKIDAAGRELSNRDTLRVTGWRRNGDAVVRRRLEDGTWSDRFGVPAAYLEESAELAYAGNVHVAQGRTVDTGHLLVTDTLSREALYVGMTRGRLSNLAHVVTGPSGGRRPAEQAPPEAVIANAMNRETGDVSATATIREAQRWATSSRHLFDLWRDLTRRTAGPAIDAAVRERLPEPLYQRYLADPQRPVLFAQLRAAQLAGHDVGEVLDDATRDSFTGANSVAAVIHGRVRDRGLGTGGTSRTWAERTPEAGQSPPEGERRAIEETTAALDHRQRELGLNLAERPEPWAVRYLGLPPAEPGPLRDDWVERAGVAASYREAAGHTDPEQAVGDAPRNAPELAEAHASAMRALEMQEEETQARGMDRGSLESRVVVYERAREWAPAEVGAELESTAHAEQDAVAQAEAARARGDEDLARSADALSSTMAAERERLEMQRSAREDFDETHAHERERARAAAAELDRRDGAPGSEPDRPEPEPEQSGRERDAEPPENEHGGVDLDLDEPTTQAEADQMAREVDAAMYEAERAEASWQQPEISQPAVEAEAEAELEI